jgi:hypothetical protein
VATLQHSALYFPAGAVSALKMSLNFSIIKFKIKQFGNSIVGVTYVTMPL